MPRSWQSFLGCLIVLPLLVQINLATRRPGFVIVSSGNSGPVASGDYPPLELNQGWQFGFLFTTDNPGTKPAGVFTISDFRFTPDLVPEPSTAAFAVLALGCLLRFRNRAGGR